MQKVTAGIITKNETVLLARRAKNRPYAGFWEFPGGKVKDGERAKQALKRELQEELSIDANVGQLITSVKMPTFELFAYKVSGFNGDIQLSVHDSLKWVPIWDLHHQDLLPADKTIAKKLCSDIEPDLETKAYIFALERLRMPYCDDLTKLWSVTIIKNEDKETTRFLTKDDADRYYIDYLHKMIDAYKRNRAATTIQRLYGE